MRTVQCIAGVLILIWVLLDVLQTTLGRGGGPMTRGVTRELWQGLLRIPAVRASNRLLSIAGIPITMLAVLLWLVLLWLGWVLVFTGAEHAIVDAATLLPADFGSRVYYVGFTIFTLGTGDYIPQGDRWQILSVIASFSGLFIATISITYLTPVVQANTHKRQLAVQITSLGRTPEEIILQTWDGEGCSILEQYLTSFIPELARLEQQHLAYPVLHYFHSLDQRESASLSIAALDEALTLVEHGIDREQLVSSAVYHPVRNTVGKLLQTLDTTFIGKAADEPSPPPPPSLAVLRKHGVPVVDDEIFAARLEALVERRRLLKGLVRNDGWEWERLRPDADGQR